MTEEFYAHSIDGRPVSEWQPLDEHLLNVASLARRFAEEFGAGEWAYLAGLWHDLGKYSGEFQQRLHGGSRVDHATAGAQYSFDNLPDDKKAKLLAYTIAGHHSGLPDGKSNEASCLTRRLKKQVPKYTDSLLKREEIQLAPPAFDSKRFAFQLSFFVRMLYSSLVDADFLDTEQFMDSEKSSWRKGYPSLEEMNKKLSLALEKLSEIGPLKEINRERAYVLKYCLEAAELRQGLFSLTVPTGGGKTLSSLAFALKHALRYRLKRIIYVIPYTSIIEQNAAVFRHILGENAVLEHHSNFTPRSEEIEEYQRSMLATENWDAPLIVTTNVQFFESLFSNRSSRCRRLHNISGSVVILDEAQMLPVPLLKPCLEALRELSSSYRTSIILCTATQPALSTTETFKDGLDNVQEIIPDPDKLYNSLRRVRINKIPEISDNELAGKLIAHRQVLCIVNTRKHARSLFEKLDNKEGCYHLSALMCPAHRTDMLKKIRKALDDDLPCRVVSTQLIEAGVDIDFPVVFRAATGIDSIAQAAGRCNREGILPEKGEVYLFKPEDGLPPGYFRHTAEAAETVLRHHDDPLSLGAVSAYFQELYWKKGDKLDEYGILSLLKEDAARLNFPFKEIAEKFSLIKDSLETLIIPWNKEAERIIQSLRYTEYPAKFVRQIQRFTIQVHPRILISLEAYGSVERFGEDGEYPVLQNMDLYRDDIGLCPDDPTFHEVENLIC